MNIKEGIRTTLFLIGRLFCYNKNSKVLYYHDVSTKDGKSYTSMSTSYNDFVAQMRILPRYGNIVSRISNPKGQFMIAFDDGFKGVYDNREFFLQNDIFPTIFVAKALIGTEGYLDETEIKELSSLGFGIQSHTISHVDLTSIDNNQLRFELSNSRLYLSQLLGKDIDEICFPIGYYNDNVIKEAKAAGYKKIYLSYPSPYEVNEVIAGRYCCQTLSLFQFKLLLRGGMDILKTKYIKQHFKK